MKRTSLLLVWGKGKRPCKWDLHAPGKWAEEGVVLNYKLGLPVEEDGRATAAVTEVKKWKQNWIQIVTALGSRHRAENILHLYKI